MREQGQESLWEQRRATAIAATLGGAGLSLVLTAAIRDDRPPAVSLALAGIYLGYGTTIFLLRSRISEAALFVAVPFVIVFLTMGVLTTQSDVFRLMNNAMLIGLSALTGWYFGVSVRWRLYLGILLVGCLLVATTVVVTADSPSDAAWVASMMTLLAGIVCVAITRLRRREHQALLTDSLTGVMNRRGLTHYLAPLRSSTRESETTLIAIDVDDFKLVNDQDGHAAGDELLVLLSTAWQENIRASDGIARIGGDEFLVVLPRTTRRDAEAIVERVRASTGIAFSAGITALRGGESSDEAMARADEALYRDKQQRKHTR